MSKLLLLTRGGGSGAFVYQLTELLGKLFNGQPSRRSPLQRHYLAPWFSSSARFARCKDYPRRRLQGRPSEDRIYFRALKKRSRLLLPKAPRQSGSLVKTQCTISPVTPLAVVDKSTRPMIVISLYIAPETMTLACVEFFGNEGNHKLD